MVKRKGESRETRQNKMKNLKKINKGLILTVIVVIALIVYLVGVEKQREADKGDINKACEEFIAFSDKYVVLPEDIQTFTGEVSKENEERIEKNIKTGLEELMVDNRDAKEIQYEYLKSELKEGYKKDELKTKVKKTITKISSYEFDGDQVTVIFNTNNEINYKYIDLETGEEQKDKKVEQEIGEEIILQKVKGEWKIVYSNLRYNNYYDDVETLKMY